MAGGGTTMHTATTLPPDLGRAIALAVAVILEIILITVMVVLATMGGGRGSMGSTEGGIWIGGGRGSRRKEDPLPMVDDMRKITMMKVLLGFGWIGGEMMRPGVV
jgi:hypothetical protein